MKLLKAFSTIEILIAMTVLLMALSGIVLVASENDSFLIDIAQARTATAIAQQILEKEKILGIHDFNLVNATSSILTIDGTSYTAILKSDLLFSPLSKILTETVTWVGAHGENERITNNGVIVQLNNPDGSDTCDSSPVGDWTKPHVKNTVTNLGPITDIDAYDGRLYVTINNNVANTANTFFILSTTTQLISSIDTATTVSAGLNAVAVASSSAGTFAYVANGYPAGFATCKPGAGNCAQLQILNVANPHNPTIISNFEIPTSSPPFVTGNGGAAGNTITYSEGLIFLGLTKTASGPEFNIIDVSNPYSPQWLGGYAFEHDVNRIVVRGNLAFVAHPSDGAEREMITVLDISDPHNPRDIASYYSGDANANGKSIDVVGNSLYMGTTVSSSKPELFTLDTSSIPLITLEQSKEIGSSVVGLMVRNTLINILTTKQGTKPGTFEILQSSNLGFVASTTLPGGASASGTAFDCEGNYFYVGSVDSANNGYVSVITAS